MDVDYLVRAYPMIDKIGVARRLLGAGAFFSPPPAQRRGGVGGGGGSAGAHADVSLLKHPPPPTPSRHALRARGEGRSLTAERRMSREQTARRTNPPNDGGRSRLVVLCNVFVDLGNVGTGARGEPQPHRPHFFQSAAISSSLTNSPR
jgi:hypothetical protein